MTIDRVEDHWARELQADVEIRPVGDEFKVYIDGVHSYTATDLGDAESFLESVSEWDDE